MSRLNGHRFLEPGMTEIQGALRTMISIRAQGRICDLTYIPTEWGFRSQLGSCYRDGPVRLDFRLPKRGRGSMMVSLIGADIIRDNAVQVWFFRAVARDYSGLEYPDNYVEGVTSFHRNDQMCIPQIIVPHALMR